MLLEPQKKPLDFRGNLDYNTLGFGLRLGGGASYPRSLHVLPGDSPVVPMLWDYGYTTEFDFELGLTVFNGTVGPWLA